METTSALLHIKGDCGCCKRCLRSTGRPLAEVTILSACLMPPLRQLEGTSSQYVVFAMRTH